MKEINYDKSHLFITTHGGGSNMAIDDIIDEEAIIENDGRSNTRTFFYPEEGNYANRKQERQYKRLIRWQDGVGDSGRAAANFKADNERTAKTFCSQCELTKFQTERVLYVMNDLDVNSYGHYSTEKVLLAVMSLVCNEDRRLLRDEPQFQSLVADMGMTMEQVRRVRKMTRERTDQFD